MLIIPLVVLAFFLARFAKSSGRKVSPVFIWVLCILLPIVLQALGYTIAGGPAQGWESRDEETRKGLFRVAGYVLGIVASILFVAFADKKSKNEGVRPNTALEPTAAAPSALDVPGNPKPSDKSTSASGGGGSALDR
jgi:hypothetical protein